MNRQRVGILLLILAFSVFVSIAYGENNELEKKLEKPRQLFGEMAFRQAVQEYKKVIKLYPNSGLAHFELGYCYQSFGQRQDALKEFQIAVQLEPNNAAYLYELAGAYGFLGKFAEHDKYMLRAKELYIEENAQSEVKMCDSALEYSRNQQNK